MKKLLAIAAMSAAASLGSFQSQAVSGTWSVVCIKQGPKRLVNLPLRTLVPNSNVAPAPAAGYPNPLRSRSAKATFTFGTNNEDAPTSDANVNFVSLGFGGVIVLEYSGKFGSVPGNNNDGEVFETTFGNPGCTPAVSEAVKVEFSQDGINWISRQGCHNTKFDIAPDLEWAKYVRLTDQTPNVNARGDGDDAFDVDGIVVNADYVPTQDPGVCNYRQGVASQFANLGQAFITANPGLGIVNQRKNFANANINEFGPAVVPSTREANGWYNFWSIGFGGFACFQLPYAVFAQPGLTPEFKMYETTWNNQPCPNYFEKVNIRVSADAINWSGPIYLCKDGTVDFSPTGIPVVNYIRFEDISSPADFGAGADAYDIDNIVILQAPPGQTPVDPCSQVAPRTVTLPAMNEVYTTGGVPEEMFPLEIVGANVVTDKIAFSATIAEEGGYTYSIRNHTGQELANGSFDGNLYEKPTAEVSTGKFPTGVYFLTLTSATGKETVKFIKK